MFGKDKEPTPNKIIPAALLIPSCNLPPVPTTNGELSLTVQLLYFCAKDSNEDKAVIKELLEK